MSVDIRGARLAYRSRGHETVALDGLDLDVADGELVAVMGPSGSGKTSLLYAVAGLEPLTGGTISVSGRDVTGLPPQERDVALVFQDLALYPHLDVRDNIALDLEARGARRADARGRAAAIAPLFHLEGLLGRRPQTLSGGERQRVALARALAREPRVLLLDEPVAHLDAPLRAEARREVVGHQRRLGISCLYVTHDSHEAMAVGDRIAVLHAGAVLQCAAPDELYERPATPEVARRIGDPPMNVLPGTLLGHPGGTVGAHAHRLTVTAAGEADVDATVVDVERRGREVLVVATILAAGNTNGNTDGHADGDPAGISVLTAADRAPSPGDVVGIRFDRSGLWRFPSGSWG